jgi:hypothetical protein
MDTSFPFPNGAESMNQQVPQNPSMDSLEKQIDAWRAHLKKSRAISSPDVRELEDHLRELIASLGAQGLSEDEAFLVAVKRMGAIDDLTREFAREHSDRLWKQLVLSREDSDRDTAFRSSGSKRTWLAIGLAVLAGIVMKIPALFGVPFIGPEKHTFYSLNMSFFTLPFIAAYFALDRPLQKRTMIRLAGAFALSAAIVNAFPFYPRPGSHTQILTSLHLPIALWLAVGVAYVGGRWRASERRMDFVRFTGELFIYFVLIALGGGVLIGLTIALFKAIGLNAEPVAENWIIPCGIAGAIVIGTWLVEAKQSVIENMAPVLTRIFAPLFGLMLIAFVMTMVLTGRGIGADREILIAFDLLLVVVFALLLYSISARDSLSPPGLFDWIQLILVGSALAVDVLALWAIAMRISEFGFTPNRVAALGENVVLLVNLSVSAILYARFLKGGVTFARLCNWQTFYLYVFAGWAAVVAFIFPLIFGFA